MPRPSRRSHSGRRHARRRSECQGRGGGGAGHFAPQGSDGLLQAASALATCDPRPSAVKFLMERVKADGRERALSKGDWKQLSWAQRRGRLAEIPAFHRTTKQWRRRWANIRPGQK